MATTVRKVTKANRAELLADPSFVWCGRASGRLGMKRSIWGNPFSGVKFMIGRDIGRYTQSEREAFAIQAVSIFESSIEQSPAEPWAEMRRRLPELRGKTLGCGCGCWKPGDPEIACHAVVLAKLADGLEV